MIYLYNLLVRMKRKKAELCDDEKCRIILARYSKDLHIKKIRY